MKTETDDSAVKQFGSFGERGRVSAPSVSSNRFSFLWIGKYRLSLFAVIALLFAGNESSAQQPDKKSNGSESKASSDKNDQGSKKDAATAKWTVLFWSSDSSKWDTNAKNTKGEQIAIPLKFAPHNMQYLRLRRGDTNAAIIIPLTADQLKNEKAPNEEGGYWWYGANKEEWKGRHLGIAFGPRFKYPAPHDKVAVAYEGWDAYFGSGFGHKTFVIDAQYYCWRGKEIKRTVFEIAVTAGPLTDAEKKILNPSNPVGDKPQSKPESPPKKPAKKKQKK